MDKASHLKTGKTSHHHLHHLGTSEELNIQVPWIENSSDINVQMQRGSLSPKTLVKMPQGVRKLVKFPGRLRQSLKESW